MLGFIRKVYKHFKSKNKELQNIHQEINMLREEIIKLRKDYLFLFEHTKILINSQNNAISNPCYFVEDEHIYEEINDNEVKFINVLPPELPPRSKIDSIKF